MIASGRIRAISGLGSTKPSLVSGFISQTKAAPATASTTMPTMAMASSGQ